ncbi:MAG: efflux RND transporter permease subunit [Verrucomicrobiota bacterium]
MGFFELFVRRRVMTTVVVLIAVIVGALAYWSMGLRRFPDIEFPVVTISTDYSGGTPGTVETEITQHIEEAVSSIAGVDNIESYSQQGMSQVVVQFDLDEDVDLKAIDVLNEVDSVRRLLPEDAEDPVVQKLEAGQEPVLTLALRGKQDVNALYRLADEELSQRLSQLSGVAAVDITGGQERELEVLLEGRKLRKHGISITEVSEALGQTNIDIPGGFITESGQEYLLRSQGRFDNLERIENVQIPTTGDGIVKTKHLGTVVDGFEDQRTTSRVNGDEAIVLTIQKQSKANDVEVAQAVRNSLPELEKLLPPDSSLEIVEDQSEYITGALNNVQGNMLLGISLTALTLFLFLSSGRATAIAAVVMPVSVIATLPLMMFSGFSLNILTLLALALSVGIVVNNSILVLENSVRFMEMGRPRDQAAALGAADIATPVLSTTATNLVVFLPIAFMGEIIGRFFQDFGLTIVYVTVVSLLVSFTLTPMMCGRLLKSLDNNKPFPFLDLAPRAWQWIFSHFKNTYLRMLDWSLRHHISSLALWGLVLVVVVGGLGRTLGGQFFPDTDEGRFSIMLQMPAGTPLEVTGRRVKEAEDIVETLPHLKHYYSRVGKISGFMGGSNRGVNLAEIRVTVSDKDERDITLDEMLDQIQPRLARIPGAAISVSKGGGGPQGTPVQVEISGSDLDEVRSTAQKIMKVVKDVDGTTGVSKSWQSGQPEMRLIPMEEEAGRHGLTVTEIANTVRSYVDGSVIGDYQENDEYYDIRVRLQEDDRLRAQQVADFFIKSPETGEMLPINEVAEVRYDSAPNLITRKDQTRYVSISSQLSGELPLSEVVDNIRNRIDEDLEIPATIDISYGGETEMMKDNFKELFKALGIAAVLTFLCTAGIIESFALAAVIIISLPLSIIGVVAAMIIAGVYINIFSLMAIIMLVGMVVNYSIIIIDYASRDEQADKPLVERVRNACEVRYRVILMANITTIAAMIPLSLGRGFAGEIFRPIAVVQIGGIFAAGFLSLLVIPVVYTIVEGIKEKRAARKRQDESSEN